MRRLILAGTVLALAASIAPPCLAQQAESSVSSPVAEAKLAYVMVFVSDMKQSVAFYRDQVGLKLRFASPGWSEFNTGGTVLALHPASRDNPAGTSQVGVTVSNLQTFYDARKAASIAFSMPPTAQSYGPPLAVMRDPDGAQISVGGR